MDSILPCQTVYSTEQAHHCHMLLDPIIASHCLQSFALSHTALHLLERIYLRLARAVTHDSHLYICNKIVQTFFFSELAAIWLLTLSWTFHELEKET